jgi:hypothetical protein
MKKVLLFAALAFAAVACNEEAAPVEDNNTEVVLPTEDEVPGPGHVEAEADVVESTEEVAQ